MQDLIIVGGGLAGLTAAIDAARAGVGVTLIERKRYPRHKVCGEYVSSEVLPYLKRLNVPVHDWQPRRVVRFRLHAPSGASVECALPLGGFGIRRYELERRMFEIAESAGVTVAIDTDVRDIVFDDDRFTIRSDDGSERTARAVIGAFGKRSALDKRLERPFAATPSTYVGVKFYVDSAGFPDDLVALYGFDGGYAGAVRVEDGTVDVAYLTRSTAIKAAGGLEAHERRAIDRNPALRELLAASSTEARDRHTIANVSFAPKEQVRRHVLMIGDAAGMIPPLCGNGMAMAVHAAKLASESVTAFLGGSHDRRAMEEAYERHWRRAFARRLAWGRRLQPFVDRPAASELAVRALRLLPGALPAIVRRTHGMVIS